MSESTSADDHRALPGPMVDLIREGVPTDEIRAQGDWAVWHALVRTAASAQIHGWTFAEWVGHVDRRTHHLGTQARLTENGTRERTDRDYAQRMNRAWETAERWCRDHAATTWTAADAPDRIHAVRLWLADGDAGLSRAEHAVLVAACDIAAATEGGTGASRSRGTCQPPLPSRVLAQMTGLSEPTVRRALHRLQTRGLLVLRERGRSGRNPETWKANIYALPNDEAMAAASASAARQVTLTGGRSYVSVTQTPYVSVTPTTGVSPEEPNTDQENEPMTTTPPTPLVGGQITGDLTPTEWAIAMRVVAEQRMTQAAREAAHANDDLPDNVTSLTAWRERRQR